MVTSPVMPRSMRSRHTGHVGISIESGGMSGKYPVARSGVSSLIEETRTT
jgi:hypothetical protein